MPESEPQPSVLERRLSRFAATACIIWLVLAIAFYVFMVLIPHGPNFAPELGPTGAFLIFGLVFSLFYLGAAVFIGLSIIAFTILGSQPVRQSPRGFEVLTPPESREETSGLNE
jgi:hypothetical protein